MRQNAVLRNIDWPILSAFLFLCFAGWINIYSAGFSEGSGSIFSWHLESGKQFFWIALSLIVGLGILSLDNRFIIKSSKWVYLFAVFLLILVLLFGREVNGARSWFGIGSFGIQPSEFAKLGAALMVSDFLNQRTSIFNNFKNRFLVAGIIAIPAFLILLQPDTGTALAFTAFVFVFYREGLSGNILLFGFLAITIAVLLLLFQYSEFGIPFTEQTVSGNTAFVFAICTLFLICFFLIEKYSVPRFKKGRKITAIVLFISCITFVFTVRYAFNEVLESHQQTRINILLGLEEDPQGAGYNIKQSKTAIGSGGAFGKGYLDGNLTKFKYVPMQSTDFIFCTVGEEWGFVGSFFIVLVFLFLIVRIIRVSERQRSRFSRVFGYSLSFILFMHLGINIGMAIGLAPVIGIPLPFFSYGGSSLLAFSASIFIFLRLDSGRLEVLR